MSSLNNVSKLRPADVYGRNDTVIVLLAPFHHDRRRGALVPMHVASFMSPSYRGWGWTRAVEFVMVAQIPLHTFFTVAALPCALFSTEAPQNFILMVLIVLREQLLSQVNTSNHLPDQHEMPTSSPASPNDPNSMDHTMSGGGMMSTSAGSDDGNDNDGRKGYGKRELSTSKRAAQNRAAQVSQQIWFEVEIVQAGWGLDSIPKKWLVDAGAPAT